MDSESVYQNCKELESEFLTSLVAHAPSPEEAMAAMGMDVGGFARFDSPSPLDPYNVNLTRGGSPSIDGHSASLTPFVHDITT
jgi:hypothetical protein